MDLPASYYGKLDKRNPVISAFDRDIKSFMTLMRRVVSSDSQDNNGSYAKGQVCLCLIHFGVNVILHLHLTLLCALCSLIINQVEY